MANFDSGGSYQKICMPEMIKFHPILLICMKNCETNSKFEFGWFILVDLHTQFAINCRNLCSPPTKVLKFDFRLQVNQRAKLLTRRKAFFRKDCFIFVPNFQVGLHLLQHKVIYGIDFLPTSIIPESLHQFIYTFTEFRNMHSSSVTSKTRPVKW